VTRATRFGARDGGLWVGAATIVFAAHVAVAYAVQNLNLAAMPDGGPPPALAIEMAPLETALAMPEQTAMLEAVSPEPPDAVEEAEKSTEVEPATDPAPFAEKAEPATGQPVDKAEATEAAALGEHTPLEEVVPDITETVDPEVVIPLPEPKPVKANKPAEAKRKAEKKPVEKPKQRQKKENTAAARPVMTASIDASQGAKAAAPQSSEGSTRSSVSPARWNASLAAWIRRHTRYPSAARSRRAEGSPNVTFTVDGSGRVVSARLARSSGDGDLDHAALNALQGASLPAPPAELGARVTRTAPFVFSLRD
jgi:protein TonB